MSDLVQRLRDSVTQARAIDRSELLSEAAGEIEKLRRRLRLADAALLSDSPSLTDAEREAIEGAINAEHARGAWKWADTLRGLLERLGGGRD